jgi:hypothetical protein
VSEDSDLFSLDILAEGFRALPQFIQGDAWIEYSLPPTSTTSCHADRGGGRRYAGRPGVDSRIKKVKLSL